MGISTTIGILKSQKRSGSIDREDLAILTVWEKIRSGVGEDNAFVETQDEMVLSSKEFVRLIRTWTRMENLGIFDDEPNSLLDESDFSNEQRHQQDR